jgi:lipoic acid synthetase
MVTKSGIMVGLGEDKDEVSALFDDLLAVGCSILTIGQYLRPGPSHLPVVEYVRPEVFDAYEKEAREKGFQGVASAPFVRSSFRAKEMYESLATRNFE